MIHNGVELQGMTHNGVEVQTWTHNGVEVYSGSKPWVAINSNGALTYPCVKPVSRSNNLNVYWQGSEVGYQTSGQGGIITKNADGTNYLPTEGCKHIRFRISTLKGYQNSNFELVGKTSAGVEKSIGKYNCAGGVEMAYNFYKDHAGIDVTGYVSVKLGTQDSALNSSGIAYIEFYN